MKSPKLLNDRQERFIHEYLLDQNASAAAGRAGYAPKSCGTQAVDLMKNPLIKERVAQELADLYARLKVNALDMLKAQVAAAYFDPAKLFDATGEPLPLHELDAETKSALTINYEKRRNGEHVLRVRQTPRHVALAALWKRYDAFEKMRAQVEREAQHALAREDEGEAGPAASAPAPRKASPAAPPVLDLERKPPLAPMPMQQADAEIASAAEAIAASALAAAPRQPAGEAAPATLPGPTPAQATSGTAPGEAPQAQANAAAQDAYDFRKDKNWMWGGRLKPTPEPEPNPLVLQAMANAKWQEQNAELQGRHLKIRPGGVVAVTPMEPGYNPPWLRDPSRGQRPRFAEGAGEFEWS